MEGVITPLLYDQLMCMQVVDPWIPPGAPANHVMLKELPLELRKKIFQTFPDARPSDNETSSMDTNDGTTPSEHDLEICRSDNSLFENQDASSELPGCVEKENSCFSVEDSEIADSAWLKDNSNSYSDSISKSSEENVESYKKDFQSENPRLFEIFHSVSDYGNESSQKIISDSKHELLCEQSVLENMHKHSLETQANAISNDTTSPSLKKNRGFQFILKAASKLN